MLMPEAVRDYVVVHELCHRKHMNHAPAFWNTVAEILPDYRQSKSWLKENGFSLIARIK
jgi:predicted metal-dependent hydrolase